MTYVGDDHSRLPHRPPGIVGSHSLLWRHHRSAIADPEQQFAGFFDPWAGIELDALAVPAREVERKHLERSLRLGTQGLPEVQLDVSHSCSVLGFGVKSNLWAQKGD